MCLIIYGTICINEPTIMSHTSSMFIFISKLAIFYELPYKLVILQPYDYFIFKYNKVTMDTQCIYNGYKRKEDMIFLFLSIIK